MQNFRSYTNEELADINLISAQNNPAAVWRVYMEQFPLTSSAFLLRLCVSRLFYASRYDSGIGRHRGSITRSGG